MIIEAIDSDVLQDIRTLSAELYGDQQTQVGADLDFGEFALLAWPRPCPNLSPGARSDRGNIIAICLKLQLGESVATLRYRMYHPSQSTSHKRKSDHLSDTHHRNTNHNKHHSYQNKKPRSENASNNFSNNNHKVIQPAYIGHSQDSLPPLPPISSAYRRQVFTHPSIDTNPEHNYERLEFLGDAYIEIIASEVIFDRFTDAMPGKMSAFREVFVKNETLHEYSVLYGFDKQLNIALGHSQPRDYIKIYGDVFEAYVAAVVLSDVDRECGFASATRWLTKLWEPGFKELGLTMMAAVDIKSKETLARNVLVKGAKVNYKEISKVVDNRNGTHTYTVGAFYTGFDWEDEFLGSGKGNSQASAGQAAAKSALESAILEEIKIKRTGFLQEKERGEAEQAAKDEVEREKAKQERQRKDAEKAIKVKQRQEAAGVEVKA